VRWPLIARLSADFRRHRLFNALAARGLRAGPRQAVAGADRAASKLLKLQVDVGTEQRTLIADRSSVKAL
jgi:hypothetical protein